MLKFQIPTHTSLVIFDCDGVLVDSEPIANRVMAKTLTHLGWPMTSAQSVERFKGYAMDQVHTALEQRLGRSMSNAWVDIFYDDMLIALQAVQAMPGIFDLIADCHKRGLKTCVASQGPHKKMAVTLGATQLLPFFKDRIFSAKDVARPKPFPDLFLKAAESCGIAPKACLVIEDSLTGLKAAQAAGMEAVYLNAEGEITHSAPTVRQLCDISL